MPPSPISAAPAQLLEPPPVPLTFRIRDEDQRVSVAHLTPAKCTIGSAPTCTLQLSGKDIRPVQCLIFRGPRQTVVRRWAPDTLLNGKPYEDAPLVAGDRLHIGPVELEVLDSAAAANDENTLLDDILDLRHQCQDLKKQLDEQRATALKQKKMFEDERTSWINAEAVQQLKSEKNEIILREILAQRDSEIEKLTSHLKQLEKESAAIRGKLDASQEDRNGELDALRKEVAKLRKHISLIESEYAEWLQTRSHAVSDPPARDGIQDAGIDAATGIETDARDPGARDPGASDPGCNSTESMAPPPEEPAARDRTDPEKTPFQPTSFIDRYSDMFDNNEANEPMGVLAPPTDPSNHGLATPGDHAVRDEPSIESEPNTDTLAAASNNGSQDEESIEQYMNRLMQRIRGETATPVESKPASPLQEPAEDPVVTNDPMATSSTNSCEPICLEDIKRSNILPEHQGNFEALRKLANSTAQQAIGIHTNRMKRHRLCSKLLVSAVGFFGGSILLYLAPNWHDTLTFYGLAALAAGIFWSGQSITMLLRIIRRGSLSAPESEPESDKDPASCPEPPRAAEEDPAF